MEEENKYKKTFLRADSYEDAKDALNEIYEANPDAIIIVEEEGKECLIEHGKELRFVPSNVNLDNLGELKEIKYADLVQLRNEGKLVAGNLYRITDYITTVANNDNARSAGHPFDVVVLALSNNTLSEEAMAIQSTRDGGYFNGCKLEAWKLWYALDNDEERFQWADKTNGKGVIYRMIDEWMNDCPYDFKNVQFKRCKVTSTILTDLNNSYVGIPSVSIQGLTNNVSDYLWCFTFSKRKFNGSEYIWEIECDMSLLSKQIDYPDADYEDEEVIPCHDNTIKPCSNKGNKYHLNNIVFIDGWVNEYSDDEPVMKTSGNVFAPDCYDMSFLGYCHNNTFGGWCYSNIFGNCCYNNQFGDLCIINIFEYYCFNNTLEKDCASNTIRTSSSNNTFGVGCHNITIGVVCVSNILGKDCASITFGDNCIRNTFGNYCSRITLGRDCADNTFGKSCSENIFGNKFQYNSIGNRVQYVNVSTENVCHTHILDGTKGVNYNKLTLDFKAESKSSQYAGLNSSGELKIWTPADLVEGGSGGIQAPPDDGNTYGYCNGEWVRICLDGYRIQIQSEAQGMTLQAKAGETLVKTLMSNVEQSKSEENG